MISKLFLVGAGPGDPELITIKAIKALASADVILYDSLANELLLEYAPPGHKEFVGKRYGCHALSQQAINRSYYRVRGNTPAYRPVKRRRSICIWPCT